MPWKAWLVGHDFDLETLSELFGAGDPLVAHDQLNGYYVESLGIVVSGGQPDVSSAEALVKRVNGAARALDPAFQTVQLRGRYTSPDGTTSVVLLGDTAAMRDKATAGAVVIDGVPAPAPPPKGPRYLKLAQQDPDVADALRVLGQPGPLDWYDIYKTWEIVGNAIGGPKQVAAHGWATEADINRLTASANHPGISGDDARHARMKGNPGQNLTMTMEEADSLVRRLVANWIESHPSY
jgi:hypothetical protein